MNTLKNVLFFGLLLAVLCGVYLSLNRQQENTLPPGLSATTTPPTVVVPGLTGPPLPSTGSGPESSGPPVFPTQPPLMSAPPPNTGGIAPPFPSPTPVGQGGVAPLFVSRDSASLPAPPASNSPPAADALPPPLATPPGNYPPGTQNPGSRDPFGGSSAPPLPEPPRSDSLPPNEHSTSIKIEQTMQQVKLDVEKQRFDSALRNLSLLYGNPDLPPSQAREVTLILDKMAAKVIYSREHVLEPAYLVQSGDTLETIADHYKVPALLLAKINGIRDPQNLPPGKAIKVLKGPFNAQISTDHAEMTMMLGGLYAGRFSVALSNDLSHAQSLWWVREKGPSAAANGSGKSWIELSNSSGNISMQGTNNTQAATGRNTIWLSEQDMEDVFGILSAGSSVIIQR
jgi:LysM repeat protein